MVFFKIWKYCLLILLIEEKGLFNIIFCLKKVEKFEFLQTG